MVCDKQTSECSVRIQAWKLSSAKSTSKHSPRLPRGHLATPLFLITFREASPASPRVRSALSPTTCHPPLLGALCSKSSCCHHWALAMPTTEIPFPSGRQKHPSHVPHTPAWEKGTFQVWNSKVCYSHAFWGVEGAAARKHGESHGKGERSVASATSKL